MRTSMAYLRGLAGQKGFEVERGIGQCFRVSCKGALMRKANGSAGFTFEQAVRYLRRFPDASVWLARAD